MGLAFLIASSMNFSNASATGHLALINYARNGKTSNHIFAVELDTVQTTSPGDIDNNYVGIDVNSLKSTAAASASYYSDKEQRNITLNLVSGKPMQVWVEWVRECWKRGAFLKASDPRLEREYKKEEMELILKVGLLCGQPRPEARPSMRRAMQLLNGDVSFSEMPLEYEEIDLFPKSSGTSAPLSSDNASTSYTFSTADSFLKHCH